MDRPGKLTLNFNGETITQDVRMGPLAPRAPITPMPPLPRSINLAGTFEVDDVSLSAMHDLQQTLAQAQTRQLAEAIDAIMRQALDKHLPAGWTLEEAERRCLLVRGRDAITNAWDKRQTLLLDGAPIAMICDPVFTDERSVDGAYRVHVRIDHKVF